MIAEAGGRAAGVATRQELLGRGLSSKEVDHRVAIGLLIVEFPGVYRAGHRAPSVEANYMAAVKSCGQGAVLSGLAAAWLWGLVKGLAPQPEVTARTERRTRGVKTHRRRRMDSRDITVHRRIPITTVPATILTLPSLLAFDDLPVPSMKPTSATALAPITSRPHSRATRTPPAPRP